MDFDTDIRLVSSYRGGIRPNYAASCTRSLIARSLIGQIWSSGHFRLADLSLSLVWTLPEEGDEAYEIAVDAASQYIDSLGLDSSCHISEEAGALSVAVHVSACDPCADEYSPYPAPFGTPGMTLGPGTLPSEALPDERSWIIYVPFDTSEYVLGGSALSVASGREGIPAPQVSDAAYFVDCYEVVRELVEDGILLAGCTVGKGGLGAALSSFVATGGEMELGDLSGAAGRPDSESLLFSEVPGALFQIRDADFDYVDAEFLLQDVAYYPLGHPSAARSGLSSSARSGLHLHFSAKTGLQQILDSLIKND